VNELGQVVAQAELAQALAELAAELGGADADAEHLQGVLHRLAERGALLGVSLETVAPPTEVASATR
jgi:hypothetical protein